MSIQAFHINGHPSPQLLGDVLPKYYDKSIDRQFNDNEIKGIALKKYKNITITGKELGRGSFGVVYPALYNTGDKIFKCVIKLPLKLIEKDKLKIDDETGNLLIPQNDDSISSLSKDRDYKNAFQNFEEEWKNAFLLRFGHFTSKLGMDKSEWTITPKDFLKAHSERLELSNHPGFDNIHSIQGIDPYVPFIMSEYFDGTLQDLAQNIFLGNQEQRVEYMFGCIIPQTYAGLCFMHDVVKLAHMDLKPINMLYKYIPGKPYPHIVLSDFGLCFSADEKTHNCAGTYLYAAPEVQKCFDKKYIIYVPKHADAFAWALCMLYLLHPYVRWKEINSLKDDLLLSEDERSIGILSLYNDQLVFNHILRILDLKSEERYKVFQNIKNLIGFPQQKSKNW